MDINLVIAENCKRIRKIQKMSIERTAEVAGVSRSMLGQIERGEANPSAALLYKIAGALKVPMEELLRYEPETEDHLFRGIDSVADRADGGKVLMHDTTPYDGFAALEQKRLDVFISGKYEPTDHIPGSRVYLTVLSGSVEVTVGEESFLLEGRDAVMFPGTAEYSYTNKSNTTVRLIERIMYQK